MDMYENWVLLKHKDIDQRSSKIIMTVDYAESNIIYGTVISVGPGIKKDSGITIAPYIKSGNVVMFEERKAHKFIMNDDVYYTIREPEILAISKADNKEKEIA